MAKRIQRKRTKGWKMPPNTIYIGRPSKWGNDYEVVESRDEWGENPTWHVEIDGMEVSDAYADKGVAIADAIELFRGAIEVWLQYEPDALAPLRGKDLACWCPIGEACHADVLLELLEKETTMFGFYYPENGERFLASVQFTTPEEAIAYWRDKRSMWQQIDASGKDKAAFLNPLTGDIVVVREISRT